jgi:hypothetical protein
MGTHRELRHSKKLEAIIRLLRPLIDRYEEQEISQASDAYNRYLNEQKDLNQIQLKRSG